VGIGTLVVVGFCGFEVFQGFLGGGDFGGVDELAEVDDFVDDARVDWVDRVRVSAVDDCDIIGFNYPVTFGATPPRFANPALPLEGEFYDDAVEGFWVACTDKKVAVVVGECVGELADEGAFADTVTAFQDIQLLQVVHVDDAVEKADETVCGVGT